MALGRPLPQGPHRRLLVQHPRARADVRDGRHGRGPSPYTQAQRLAWMPEPRHGKDWHKRLDKQIVFTAQTHDSIVGFMSLLSNMNPENTNMPVGYIDFAYIRPTFQGTGLFRRLYNMIESLAKNEKLICLWTHASLSAEPAFGAMGFDRIEAENVSINGEKLKRFKMEKHFGR